VNAETIAALKEKLTEEAEVEYVKERGKSVVLLLTLGAYNAEKETFAISEVTYGAFTVKVPLNVARDFKSLWEGLTKTPTLAVENDALTVKSITFRMPDGQEFVATK
jgi:hypothetical protein